MHCRTVQRKFTDFRPIGQSFADFCPAFSADVPAIGGEAWQKNGLLYMVSADERIFLSEAFILISLLPKVIGMGDNL